MAKIDHSIRRGDGTIGPRSKQARRRGPDWAKPENVPDIDTPGYGRSRNKRYSYRDLQGEERIDILRRIRDCALAGMNDFEIAQEFGIALSTLNRWGNDDPHVAAALAIPKEIADARVERALYHLATGYSFRSEKIHVASDGMVTRVPIIEHRPPDRAAAEFWLSNRQQDKWRKQVDVNMSGSVDVTDNTDPRRLAMAMLVMLKEGMQQAPAAVIDHEAQPDEHLPADNPPPSSERAPVQGVESIAGAKRRSRRS